MKKLLLTLGSAAAVAAPMATVVACNEPVYTNLITVKDTTSENEEFATAIANLILDDDGAFEGAEVAADITVTLSNEGDYAMINLTNFNGEDINFGDILIDWTGENSLFELENEGTEDEKEILSAEGDALVARVEALILVEVPAPRA